MKPVWIVMTIALTTFVGSAQSPVPSSSLAGPSDASEVPKDWAFTSDVETAVDLRPLVHQYGPGIKISAPGGLTIVRPSWVLSGTYTVSALFQRTPVSSISAGYGLIVGAKSATDGGMTFLVRPDGQFAVGKLSALTWALTTALRSPTADGPAVDRLEVRVRTSDVVFVVNGQPLAVVPIGVDALDGRPGVHVGADGEVLVAAFAVAGPAAWGGSTVTK